MVVGGEAFGSGCVGQGASKGSRPDTLERESNSVSLLETDLNSSPLALTGHMGSSTSVLSSCCVILSTLQCPDPSIPLPDPTLSPDHAFSRYPDDHQQHSLRFPVPSPPFLLRVISPPSTSIRDDSENNLPFKAVVTFGRSGPGRGKGKGPRV